LSCLCCGRKTNGGRGERAKEEESHSHKEAEEGTLGKMADNVKEAGIFEKGGSLNVV